MSQLDATSAGVARDAEAKEEDSLVQISEKQLHVIEAATPLFIQHGFHETNVRMIADAANMPMGSLYQYIQSKEHLLYLAAMHVLQQVNPVIMRHPDATRPIRGQIAELLADYIRLLDRNRRVFKMVYRETASLGVDTQPRLLAAESRLIEVWVEHVDAGIQSGEISPCNGKVLSLNLQMFAHSWSIKGWWLKRYVDLDTYLDEQVINALRMIPFTK